MRRQVIFGIVFLILAGVAEGIATFNQPIGSLNVEALGILLAIAGAICIVIP